MSCITRTTMELGFIALDKAGKEAEWLRHFLKDILLWPNSVNAICIYCDNLSTLMRAKNTVYNEKSKYIRCKHNTIR